MQVLSHIKEMKQIITQWQAQGLSIGFVPTMGYLHHGHMSLIKQAREKCDRVVVSIFVNPTQFGVNEDLSNYPRNLEQDSKLCLEQQVDVIFHPEAKEMYPHNFFSYVDMETLTEGLCGAKRAGHFRGVCTVVMKLFNIIQPTAAYFGQKDAQQLAIIKKMVQDFNMDVEVVGLPIVREADGLAMSSRNSYLNAQERKAALCLYQSLQQAQHFFQQGLRDPVKLKHHIESALSNEPLAKIDYIEIVDSDTLKSIDKINTSALCALAVFIGKTRLIDNLVLA